MKYQSLPTLSKIWVLVLFSLSLHAQETSDEVSSNTNQNDWENPGVFERNKLEPRSSFIPYASLDELKTKTSEASSFYIHLNGRWKFHFSEKPGSRPLDFFRTDYDDSDWATIAVPSNWELQGYDYPIYTNIPNFHVTFDI